MLPTTIRRSLAHVAVTVGALVASTVTSTVAPAPAADAMTPQTRTPYRYGATGPRAFDCSGYTRWVFDRVGRHLPRTSRAQARATRHVRASQRRTGDLVFFKDHGRVYHVGIYAGYNSIWHAPRSGQRVHRERLWTTQVSYGRVR